MKENKNNKVNRLFSNIKQSVTKKARKNKIIHRRTKGRFLLLVGICGIGAVATFIISWFIMGFTSVFTWTFWRWNIGIDILIIAAILIVFRVDAQNAARNSADLEDTTWLTRKEIKRSPDFEETTWSNVRNTEDGIVVVADKLNKKQKTKQYFEEKDSAEDKEEIVTKGEEYCNEIDLTVCRALHTVVVGTTGVGKTKGFLNNNISFLANSKSKPSMLMTDPKGELFTKYGNTLEKLGYRVGVIDLEKPYSSTRWNPFEIICRRIRILKAHTHLNEILQSEKKFKVMANNEDKICFKPIETWQLKSPVERFEDSELPASMDFFTAVSEYTDRYKVLESLKHSPEDFVVYVDDYATGKEIEEEKLRLQEEQKKYSAFTVESVSFEKPEEEEQKPQMPLMEELLFDSEEENEVISPEEQENVTDTPESERKEATLVKVKDRPETEEEIYKTKCRITKDGKIRRYFVLKGFMDFASAKDFLATTDTELFEYAQNVIYTICPITDKTQPVWQTGARNLILSFVVAMCEDAIAGRLPVERITVFNMYKNLQKYASGNCSALKDYLLIRREQINPFSSAIGLAQAVLITEDRQLASYLSEVSLYLQQFVDKGIQAMTIENELDLSTFDDEPTAFFIIIPPVKAGRYSFATLFISQLYVELNYKANLRQDQSRGKLEAVLKRKVYFLLEEFGVLPKLEGLDKWVNLGRSMGIRFVFIMQAFTQMKKVYGDELTSTILGGCNVKVYLGTSDSVTRKEFSEMCGNRKVTQSGINTSNDATPSANTSVNTQPLISPAELMKLNGEQKGSAIIVVTGYNPIYAEFAYSYDKDIQHLYFPYPDAMRRGERFNEFTLDDKHEAFVSIEKVLNGIQNEVQRNFERESQEEEGEVVEEVTYEQRMRQEDAPLSDKKFSEMTKKTMDALNRFLEILSRELNGKLNFLAEVDFENLKKLYSKPDKLDTAIMDFENFFREYETSCPDIEKSFEMNDELKLCRNQAFNLITKYVDEREKRKKPSFSSFDGF